MKINSMLAIICASLSLASAAHASDLADQAYDEGWDAANDFCRDVEEGTAERSYRRRNITERFEKNCKQGFDSYINHNRSCKRKLERSDDGYRRMWRARRDSCS
jgi:hypothetical protein